METKPFKGIAQAWLINTHEFVTHAKDGSMYRQLVFLASSCPDQFDWLDLICMNQQSNFVGYCDIDLESEITQEEKYKLSIFVQTRVSVTWHRNCMRTSTLYVFLIGMETCQKILLDIYNEI